MSERIFSNEDIERILKRALKHSVGNSGGVSESELYKIASELNISKEQVWQAIRYESENAGLEEAKQLYINKKKGEFKEHLTAYLIVNCFLMGLNLFTLGNISWALFPLFGWGIGLAFDYMASYHPDPIKVEQGARKLMKSNKWKNMFEDLGFKFLEGLKKK